MRWTRRLPVLAAAALCGMVPAAAVGDDVDARLAFRITDERVTESSGLAVSRTRPRLAYTVNDSGDEARVLVLSTRDGTVVGETRLTGVDAVDVEALAPARGGRLVVADIGDNAATRDSVQIYVIPEPQRGDAEVVPRRVSLTYPGGPRDAEAVVAVGRRVYVISKELFAGTVFSAPVLGSPHGTHRLRRVAAAPGTVTDAALLADGRVVVRDYHRAAVMGLPRWRRLTAYSLPHQRQGESLAAAPDGPLVYVGSEGDDSPVFAVPVPSTSPRQRAAVTQDDNPASERPVAQPEDEPEQEGPRARPPGYIVAVAAAMVLGLLLRRYRRRTRR